MNRFLFAGNSFLRLRQLEFCTHLIQTDSQKTRYSGVGHV